ncbi:MAG TPA: DUF3578 domain-containing protein [Thiopseudomonas sp.]|nr:DUF3578 domain-containing protein [Thiopseudomonas sp.]
MSMKLLLSKIAGGWVKAKSEKFTEHPIANLLRQDLIDAVKNELGTLSSNCLIKSSAGTGNWADVPWLSILNPLITKSTQSGVYPVYLFRADGSGIYLSLGFGTTELKKKFGALEAKKKAQELRTNIRSVDFRLKAWDEKIDLRSSTVLGQSYEWASAGAKFYPLENIPSDSSLLADLNELLEIYADVNIKLEKSAGSNLTTEQQVLPKPFLLLAGISGTGKTRFVREQAKATGSLAETYCLTPVRPDWHEPSDLLGYTSRLNGKAEYITTDVLQFIAQAWRAKADAGLSLDVEDIDGHGTCFVASGDATQLDSVLPYWLCLDEMNLAPVEQYFADYLSILETREWSWTDDSFRYLSDPLLKASTIQQLEETEREKLGEELGFIGDAYEELWALICKYGMGIPFNLIVAGTVNMDETTHGFSRKVIDRALSFDFGEFFPNDFTAFFAPTTCNKTLSYPIYSHANKSQTVFPDFDSDGQKSIEFLNKVNAVLKETPFELAYRAVNELLLAVICAQPADESELKAVWDDFLMCKVLPRIEGDADKLGDAPSILEQLEDLLAKEFSEIWNPELDSPGSFKHPARPDLYREYQVADGAPDSEKMIRIECRSKSKIQWMQKRLVSPGFTSFWP